MSDTEKMNKLRMEIYELVKASGVECDIKAKTSVGDFSIKSTKIR